MKDITVIIPIYQKFTEEDSKLFERALSSVPSEVKVIVVGPKDIMPENNGRFKELVNKGNLDFCSQVNFAVSKVDTDYFSILEYDDMYTPIWRNNFISYSDSHLKESSVYLFLNELYDYKNISYPIGYINEPVWASSFSEEIGYIDMECLSDYSNFNMTGGIINTKDFISVGGLKPSMKLSFWYEFMLRLLHNGKQIFVIPKIGYYHFINRENSLIDTYQKEMSEDEAKWWIELAKKEYFFKTDRQKTYE